MWFLRCAGSLQILPQVSQRQCWEEGGVEVEVEGPAELEEESLPSPPEEPPSSPLRSEEEGELGGRGAGGEGGRVDMMGRSVRGEKREVVEVAVVVTGCKGSMGSMGMASWLMPTPRLGLVPLTWIGKVSGGLPGD